MQLKKVDARGLSCPQPVLLTMEALKTPADEYEIIVDNATANGNVTRFLKHAGKTVESTLSEDGDITIHAR